MKQINLHRFEGMPNINWALSQTFGQKYLEVRDHSNRKINWKSPKLVILVMAMEIDIRGNDAITYETLIQLTGIASTTMDRVLRFLEDNKYITVIRGVTVWTTNRYKLNLTKE